MGQVGNGAPQLDWGGYGLPELSKNSSVQGFQTALLYENIIPMGIGLVTGVAIGGLLLFVSDPCNDASYQRALELATEAVVLGQQAPLSEPSDALAQWQRADSLWDASMDNLARVRTCSEYFEPAQERLETYAENRQRVQQEIANLNESADRS